MCGELFCAMPGQRIENRGLGQSSYRWFYVSCKHSSSLKLYYNVGSNFHILVNRHGRDPRHALTSTSRTPKTASQSLAPRAIPVIILQILRDRTLRRKIATFRSEYICDESIIAYEWMFRILGSVPPWTGIASNGWLQPAQGETHLCPTSNLNHFTSI